MLFGYKGPDPLYIASEHKNKMYLVEATAVFGVVLQAWDWSAVLETPVGTSSASASGL